MLVLPLSLCIVAIVVFALAGAVHGNSLHARGITLSKHLRVADLPLITASLFLFVALVVVTHSTMSHPEWLWHLPSAVDYHMPPVLQAFKVAFVTFAMTAVTWLAVLLKHKRRIPLVVGAAVVVVTIVVITRVSSAPRLPELHERVSDGVILQSTGCTCAAATCANIAGRLGIRKTEAEMANLLRTTWAGTSPAQMVYGLRSLGLQTRKVLSPTRNPLEIRAPAILPVDYGTIVDGHAVAFMGMKDGRAEIWDPAGGVAFHDPVDWRKRWRGRAIEVFRMES